MALLTNFLWPQSILELESRASGTGAALGRSNKHYQGVVVDLACPSRAGVNTCSPRDISLLFSHH